MKQDREVASDHFRTQGGQGMGHVGPGIASHAANPVAMGQQCPGDRSSLLASDPGDENVFVTGHVILQSRVGRSVARRIQPSRGSLTALGPDPLP